MTSTPRWNRNAERAASLLTLALAASLVLCCTGSSPRPETVADETTAGAASAQQPSGEDKPEKKKLGYRRVRPTIAFEMLRDSPDIFILDLRTAGEFLGSVGRLSRAVNIPLEELEGRLVELEPLKSRTFLVYCRRGSCGHEGMVLLRSRDFRDAMLIDAASRRGSRWATGWCTTPFSFPRPVARPDGL